MQKILFRLSSGLMLLAFLGLFPAACGKKGVTVTTLAGTGNAGWNNGTGTDASFSYPYGVAVDSTGNVYVADWGNNLIRKITATGEVTTWAGGGSGTATNGTGTSATFWIPTGVAVDSNGNVYVADQGNHLIRKIDSNGVVTTLAGRAGVVGSSDGPAKDATFNLPTGVAVDAAGNVYVADSGNHVIRKISEGGVVTTLAGSAGVTGSGDGTGIAADFNTPFGVAVDASGNVYVADYGNHLIRKINSAGLVTTLAGTGVVGSANGPATAAQFFNPEGIAVDSSGNVFAGDSGNHLIRKITPDGMVSTLAGTGQAGYADGPTIVPSFSWHFWKSVIGWFRNVNAGAPVQIIGGAMGVTTGGLSSPPTPGNQGMPQATPAGTAMPPSRPVVPASFQWPAGIAVDSSGTVYVADRDNHMVRKIK